jgi:hypothetical protein
MFYTIYKITNQIDGKFYIGSHKTKDLNDNYMGSGKYLIHAQKKYGIEKFKKEILFVFDTAEEMYAKEAELVNEDFLATENTYNLKVGGFGGWDYLNDNRLNIYGNNGKLGFGGENLKPPPFVREDYTEEDRQRVKEKLSSTIKSQYENGKIPNFKGKQHSLETKRIIGEKNSKNQNGEKNSQYGTRWIHSLEEKVSKKIPKESSLPEGWLEGRKIKFD